MEWIRKNSSVLILGSFFLIYTIFNESKPKEKHSYIIERDIVLNLDSIQSEIERKNRIMLDSAINKERIAIDSLKNIVRKDLNRYRSLEQEINDINHIIEPLPAF